MNTEVGVWIDSEDAADSAAVERRDGEGLGDFLRRAAGRCTSFGGAAGAKTTKPALTTAAITLNKKPPHARTTLAAQMKKLLI